ncbi:histidine phosphatase family protein [bacterium]|nr:histidine phosphatase family protein [bacterium]
MKTLCLLRHAKSDWDASYGADHERPLNERGKRAAKSMGSFLKQEIVQPEIILSSTAKRTKETLSLLMKHAGWNASVTYLTDLYLCSRADIIKQLSHLDDKVESALVVGHQPTTGDFASWLLGGSQVDVPTGTFMMFSIPISSWRELKAAQASMKLYVTPRQLEN